MKVWALWVALFGVIADASHLHRKKDELTADAGSAIAAGADEDSVAELRQQLQESQQEDDTNEAIIESLLGKQQALSNTTVALRKELQEMKKKVANTSPPMDVNEKMQMQKQMAALQLSVRELTTKLSSSEKKESEEEGLVSTLKLQNAQIQRRNMQLLNESKWKSKEGRQLRQSLAKTKLALLQSMNTGTQTQKVEKPGTQTQKVEKVALLQSMNTGTQTKKISSDTENVDAGGGGAVISSSEVRALSEKLFSASEALNGQVTTLSKKLKKETEKVKVQKVKISDLEAENTKLKSRAQSKSDEREALESSYAEMDSELAQTLHNLRHEEKTLRQGALSKAKETDAQVEELQAENARLKAAGQEVMQKYDLLSKAYAKQQRQMSFIESKNTATKKSTKKLQTNNHKVAALKPLAHKAPHHLARRAPRVFLERSSHYGSPHWRPSAARAFAALRRHEMMLLQQKSAPAKAEQKVHVKAASNYHK